MAGLLLLTGCAVSGADGGSEPTEAPSPAAPTASGEQNWWVPAQGERFQIQYSGQLDMSVPVDTYLLDWESTKPEEAAELKSRGVRLVCYINAGAFEDWRSDVDSFPQSVIGKGMEGWAGEAWLDVNRMDVLLPIMAARMDVCAEKGFDAIDPDNTDGWIQQTGFTISPEAQIAYQTALADAAHERGLSIGLKNNAAQLPELGRVVDFAVNEECIEFDECDEYDAFLASGKAVFNIEYTGKLAAVCAKRPEGMSTVIKDLKLDAAWQAC